MTPIEVMSFPKVTQLVGHRFFSWALEAIGMDRKDLVLELARPLTLYLCELCVGLCVCTWASSSYLRDSWGRSQ